MSPEAAAPFKNVCPYAPGVRQLHCKLSEIQSPKSLDWGKRMFIYELAVFGQT